MEVGKSDIFKAGHGLETQGRIDVAALSLKAISWQISFFLREAQSFLLRTSTDWVRPTHIMKSNLLFSISWFKW